MTGRKIMEEKIFTSRTNTALEMLRWSTCKTFKWRRQRDSWLNVSENDLLQMGKHKFNYMENTLNMAASQKAFIMGYYSVFTRKHLPEVYLVMLMKTMMKRKEGEGKGEERRYRRQGRGEEIWKSSNTWGLKQDVWGHMLGQGSSKGLGSMRDFHLKFLDHHKDRYRKGPKMVKQPKLPRGCN